jgi:hypothetical protein
MLTQTHHILTSFGIQNVSGRGLASTFQDIHRLQVTNVILSFNLQVQSSFNSLLPHRQFRSDPRVPKSTYIWADLPPSHQPPYHTNIHLDNMSWPSPMAQAMLSHPADQEYFDNKMSNATFSGHWKASLNPMEGQEGITPYLRQQEFDKASIVLDENNESPDTELIFDDCQDAYDWRCRLRLVNPQSASDPTIPRSTEQRKAAVKLVFKAYKSVALATDNPGMLKAFEEQKHDNRHVETICWTIVEGCIDRCDRGPLLNAYEPEKAKNTASIKTFAERLDAIVESLSHQKTICKHLLDAPYLNRFLDDPVGSKQRVESNRKLNKRKGGVMDVGKKALGMSGRKGRPPGVKKSEVGSGDEGDEYGSENQEFQGESSGISSPFRTPDQPISRGLDYSGPPSIGMSRLHSAEQYRNQSPTPAGRRQRAGTANSLSSLRSGTPQSPYVQQYGSPTGTTLNGDLGHQLPSMSMLPGSMVDPALSSYTTNYAYGMDQTSDSMIPYDIANVSTLFLPGPIFTNLGQQNPYTPHLSSAYPTSYATGPTSAPFQLSDQYTGSQSGLPSDLSGGSNDDNGSDDEWVPNPSRKRRRPQQY